MHDSKSEPVSAGYKIVELFRTVFVYLLAAAIIVGAVMFATNQSPTKSFFGFRYYTVLTDSMQPEFSTGDMVIVKLKDSTEIQQGDIITFNPSSSSDAYLTHRVTEKIENYEGTGVTCFRTKGDANNSEDSFLIDEDRVIGTVEVAVPKLGMMVRFVQLKWYFVVPLVLLAMLFFRLLEVYFSSDEEKETPAAENNQNQAG